MKGTTEMIVIGKDGRPREEPDDYVLQPGESFRRPMFLMDHDTSGRGRTFVHDDAAQDAGDKPHTWNGRGLALHRPGFRSAAVLRDAADTGDIAALETAKAINAARDALAEQRAEQTAEQKQRFDAAMYPTG
jgi:hypothetical protein